MCSFQSLSGVKCSAEYKLNPYRGTCVRFFRTRKNWFDAKMDCERKGEFLATFDTVESASWYRQQQLTAGLTTLIHISGYDYNFALKNTYTINVS